MVAQMRQPFGVFDHAVELVAVQHQEAPPVRQKVDDLVLHLDLAEIEVDVLAGKFVVIARNERYPGALASLAQQFLHDVVVGLRPVPRAAQTPTVDNVAHQVEIFGFGVLQEVE